MRKLCFSGSFSLKVTSNVHVLIHCFKPCAEDSMFTQKLLAGVYIALHTLYISSDIPLDDEITPYDTYFWRRMYYISLRRSVGVGGNQKN